MQGEISWKIIAGQEPMPNSEQSGQAAGMLTFSLSRLSQ
jgi:hypothetical protein